MPCYQIRTVSIDFNATNKSILEAALTSLGYQFYYTNNQMHIKTPNGEIIIANGKATMNQTLQDTLNNIKQAYSKKTIEQVARKYKFTMTNRDNNKIILRRYP